jgi:hypothetical protein
MLHTVAFISGGKLGSNTTTTGNSLALVMAAYTVDGKATVHELRRLTTRRVRIKVRILSMRGPEPLLAAIPEA